MTKQTPTEKTIPFNAPEGATSIKWKRYTYTERRSGKVLCVTEAQTILDADVVAESYGIQVKYVLTYKCLIEEL